MSEFYSLRSKGSRGTIYASEIMNNDKLYNRCSGCGVTDIMHEIYSVSLLLEGKGKFADIMQCGEYPFLIVSSRVIDVWLNNSITGFIPHNIKLYRKKGRELIEETSEKYYTIEVVGRAEYDLSKMNVKTKARCIKCGKATFNKDTWEFGKAYLKEDSWDGSDIFVCKDFIRSVKCTKKILELSYLNNFTNISFGYFGDSFNYSGAEDVNLKKMFK